MKFVEKLPGAVDRRTIATKGL